MYAAGCNVNRYHLNNVPVSLCRIVEGRWGEEARHAHTRNFHKLEGWPYLVALSMTPSRRRRRGGGLLVLADEIRVLTDMTVCMVVGR